MNKLGKIKEVKLRDIWKNEEIDFTPWLAEEENIEYINSIIGLSLVNVKTEVSVGPFECDIMAEDETTGTTVIIENQLEKTDHDHLGKLITYASGLDAKVLVWICKEATEQHRAAVEWLNNHLEKEIGIFLIEIHAKQIGDSIPAPDFVVVEQPNEFINSRKTKITTDENNKSQSERFEFWQLLNEELENRDKPFNVRKASTDHWYDVAIGSSYCHIAITLVNKENKIGVELSLTEPDKETIKKNFDIFLSHKEEIEKELGFELEWLKLEDKKSSRIISYIPGLNFDDHSNYKDLIDKTIIRVLAFKKTFSKYIKEFKEI